MCPALLKCRAHFKTATANWAAPLGQAGADYNSAIESSVLFTAATPMPSFQSWDLTSLTRQWVNGAAANYGIILLADNESQIAHDLRFHSADSTPNSVNQPVLEVVWTQQQRSVYYLKDHLGSVRASVDDNGQLLSRDDYDPWGLQLAGRSMTAQPNLPNKFTGKERDTDFGLNWDYFGARPYDFEIGRFVSIDPATSFHPDYTPYHYTFNNPLRFVDLFGADTTESTEALAPTLFALRAVYNGVSVSTAMRMAAASAIVTMAAASAIVLGTPGKAGEQPIGRKGEDVDQDGTDDSKDLVDNRTSTDTDDGERELMYHYTAVPPEAWTGPLAPNNYITTNPNYTGKQAASRLALPPGPTPAYRLTFKVKPGDYRPADGSLPFNRVRPRYRHLGFGKEFQNTVNLYPIAYDRIPQK